MAIAVSVVLHAVGLAAVASWSTSSKSSSVRFAGREQAFPLTLSITEPPWNSTPVSLDNFEIDPPVVIEPSRARVGKRTYIRTPTIEFSSDDLLLGAAVDPPLPERATSATELPAANPQSSESAVAVRPSNLASSLGNTEEFPPDLSQNTPPSYPARAIQSRWEGTVLLRVWIDAAGHVTKVEVARSSGYPILDGAATAAVRQWKAIPANRGGKPVTTITLLPVCFKL